MSGFMNNMLNSLNLGALKEQAKNTLGNVQGGGLPGGSIGGLLGAGALGGLIGALISGKSPKKVAGGVLKVGGTAAAGLLAWNLYKRWSSSKQPPTSPQGSADHAPAGGAAAGDPSATLLLEAMVFAAKADGHIDELEQKRIHEAVEKIYPGQDMSAMLDSILSRPIDPASIASRVSDPDEARAVYQLSCLIVDIDHFMERSYLDALAEQLGLSQDVKARLEQEAELAKKEDDS